MRFDAIVFDFDGVLVESAHIKTQAFAMLYAEYGPETVERVVKYHRSKEGITRFQKFKVIQEELLGLPYYSSVEEYLGRRFSSFVLDAVVDAPYVKGALSFLRAYYRKMPLYIASGIPEPELQEIVTRRGMVRYFSSVRGSPDNKSKILSELIQQGGFSPARVLMVGDTIADLEGALNARTAFIGRTSVENGNPFPEGTLLVRDLRPLKRIIGD